MRDTLAADAPPHDPAARRRAFGVVLAIELWERFGFYGTQAILLLYMVRHLRLAETDANLLSGAFYAFVYIMPPLGGALGDRILGARRTTLFGACILALGYFMLAAADALPLLLFLAMGLISVGNGFFKPNAGNLVRRIYEGDDTTLDSAFTLYYMSVNVGASVSLLATPWLDDRFGAPIAFSFCGCGLLIGVGYVVWRGARLAGVGTAPDAAPGRLLPWLLAVAGSIATTLIVAGVLSRPSLARDGVWLAGVCVVIFWIRLYRGTAPERRPGLRLTYLLLLEGALYMVFYEQMQTSLTLFSLHAVSSDLAIGSVHLMTVSPGQFQALNSLWIMAASPILAVLYQRLAETGRNPSLSQKLLAGYALVALSFVGWWWASTGKTGPVNPWVMIAAYLPLSVGELMISGLALAVVARYAPPALSGVMMGALYLLWGIALYVGSMVANMAALGPGTEALSRTVTAASYAPLFGDLALAGGGVVALVAALLPLERAWERRHHALTGG